MTFGKEGVLPIGYDEYLLSIPIYDALIHAPIKGILTRLAITIEYESFYGGEGFQETLRAMQ